MAWRKAALAVAKGNGTRLPDFQALLIQGADITATDFNSALRIAFPIPVSPVMDDGDFVLDLTFSPA